MLKFDDSWISYDTITKEGKYVFDDVRRYATRDIAKQLITHTANLIQNTDKSLKSAIDYTGTDDAKHAMVKIGLHQGEVKEDIFDTPYHFTLSVPTLGSMHIYVKIIQPDLGKLTYGLQVIRATYGRGGSKTVTIEKAPIVQSAQPTGKKQDKWDESAY